MPIFCDPHPFIPPIIPLKNQELNMNTAILNPSIQQASTPFIAPKLFTAKRLVNTKNMTQAEWLEVRRQGRQ